MVVACLHRVLGTVPVAASPPKPLPLVVFAHAAGFCKEIWLPAMAELADLCNAASPPRAMQAVAFDFSGHGDTPVGTADAKHWPSFAGRDVLVANQLARRQHPAVALAPTTVIGVGHSMGGAALVLAEQAAPGTFTHLELVEPIISPPLFARIGNVSTKFGAGPGMQLHKSALKRRNEWANASEARAYFDSRGMCRGWAPACVEAYVEHGLKHRRPDHEALQLKCDPAFEASLYLNLPVDLWAGLPAVAASVRVTVARQGMPWLLASAPLLQRRLPRCELSWEEGGHFWPMEHPALVARNVMATVVAAESPPLSQPVTHNL